MTNKRLQKKLVCYQMTKPALCILQSTASCSVDGYRWVALNVVLGYSVDSDKMPHSSESSLFAKVPSPTNHPSIQRVNGNSKTPFDVFR